MKNITIKVEGEHCTGKSRIIFILKEFMKKRGFDVELEPTLDYKNEKLFDECMCRTIDKSIPAITDNTKIVFKEVNLITKIN